MESATHTQPAEELIAADGGDTAVLLVHGIGVQKKNDTLETYGGAIERLWTNFGAENESFSTSWVETRVPIDENVEPDKLIELNGGTGLVTIGECHWDPVVDTVPSPRQLGKWLLANGPASLLFSCRFPS